MKRLVLCLRIIGGDSYVGGLNGVVNAYCAHKSDFEENGFRPEIYSYSLPERLDIKFGPLNNILYAICQRHDAKKKFRGCTDAVFHIHTSRGQMFVRDVLLARAMSRMGIKTVMTIHVGSIDTVFKGTGLLKNMLIKIMSRYISAVLFMSNEVRGEFIRAGLDEEKARTLYNFYDLPEAANENGLLSCKGGITLRAVYFGSLNREKGIRELLEAMERTEGVTLDICGSATESGFEGWFDEKCAELKDRVKYHGYVGGKEKYGLLKRADVLLLPSHREGFPISTLEGIASGCALVITPAGAMKEVYTDKNAVFVRPGSAGDIADALTELCRNRVRLREMQKNNIRYSAQFTVNKHIASLCRIISGIL